MGVLLGNGRVLLVNSRSPTDLTEAMAEGGCDCESMTAFNLS